MTRAFLVLAPVWWNSVGIEQFEEYFDRYMRSDYVVWLLLCIIELLHLPLR